MRRILNIFALCLLFAISAGAGAARETAAPPAMQAPADPAILLPLVANGSAVDGPATFTVLTDYDTTVVTAAVVPDTCRVILTFINRRDGNVLLVKEHVGDKLADVPIADAAAAAAYRRADSVAPAFQYPGPKQASGFPVFVCGRFRVYANTRMEQTGPFLLTVYDAPIPPPPAAR